MKKLILILASILFLTSGALAFINWHDNYSAERKLWMINRQLAYIATHNESMPDFAVDHLAAEYRHFISAYPKTVYSLQARLALGDLFALRKNYGQARKEYKQAIGDNEEISAGAETAIAKTYEAEGNWQEALKKYTSIMHEYPTTYSGFYIPLYLASHEGSYAQALDFYQRTAAEHPKTHIEYDAMRMTAICELNQKDYNGAVKTMADLILKYPTGKALKEAVSTINLLTVTQLHDYGLGIDIYEHFIQKYPHHPADPILNKMIKDLQLLENKKLLIRTAAPPAQTPAQAPAPSAVH